MRTYDNRNPKGKKVLTIDLKNDKLIYQEEYGIFNINPEKFADPANPGRAPYPDPRLPIRIYLTESEAIRARNEINDRRVTSGLIDVRGYVHIRRRVVSYSKWEKDYRR